MTSSTITAAEFLHRVEERGAFPNTAEAQLAVTATLAAVGEQLFEEEAHWLVRELPVGIVNDLSSEAYFGGASLATLYASVAERLGVSYARAMEEAQVVCETLGAALSPPARERLGKLLPGITELLHSDPHGAARLSSARGFTQERRAHTLADGSRRAPSIR